MKALAIVAVVVALLGASIWWEVSLWQECRMHDSFFYCWRVLSK